MSTNQRTHTSTGFMTMLRKTTSSAQRHHDKNAQEVYDHQLMKRRTVSTLRKIRKRMRKAASAGRKSAYMPIDDILSPNWPEEFPEWAGGIVIISLKSQLEKEGCAFGVMNRYQEPVAVNGDPKFYKEDIHYGSISISW